MFRFSLEQGTLIAPTDEQLADAGITQDDSFSQGLEDTGDSGADDVIFRVENESPETLRAAIAYVQGVLGTAPRLVWLGDEVHEVTAEEANQAATLPR